MSDSYSHKTHVKTHETDYRLQLKTSALLQYFQDVAVHHVMKLGVSYEEMKSHGLFWVVTRFHIEIDRMPVYGEEIEVETWPKRMNQNVSNPDTGKTSSITKGEYIFLRDFLVKDKSGIPLIRATSSWFVLDFRTKRPQPASKVPVNLPVNMDRQALTLIPEKIPEPEYPVLVYRKQVGYSDIDLNLHVNNTRYADWIMDVFSKEFLEKRPLRELRINYLREVRWDDKIDLFRAGQEEEGQSYIIEGIEQRTGKASFRALLKFD